MGSVSPLDAVTPTSPRNSAPSPAPKPADDRSGMAKDALSNGLEQGRRPPRNFGACISRIRILDIVMRSATLAFMVVSLSFMFTSGQRSAVSILGFNIGVSLRWNRSQPFEFLVVVNLILAAYASLQFVHQSVVLAKRALPTQRRMWLQFAADQACTYLVLAAAAAAAGASRTNRSAFQTLGVQNIQIAGVCTVLDKFCQHAVIAFIFTLLGAIASAISAALDVYVLTVAQRG